jgi:DNA polymerase III subunit beta
VKFTCEKSLLESASAAASRASAAKSTIPALEGLLIETAEDSVVVTGYDLKMGIRTKVVADVSESGAIVVNARLICDIVRRMPSNILTFKVSEGTNIKISCGMSVFEIVGSSAEDYPELPSVDYQNFINIPQKVMRSLIAETNFAVSDNETRPIHTGSLFEIESGIVTVVSVDGYRLALRREAIENVGMEKGEFVAPGAALSEVEKIASDSNEMMKLTVGSRHILFIIGDTELVSRRLEGEFLNYRQAIPKDPTFSIEVERRLLMESVERVSLMINERLKSPVRCVIGNNSVKLQAVTALGRATDECEAKGSANDLEIGFNNRYLLDALKAAPADKIKILLSSGVLPCVMIPADGSDKFLYMILPVRLKAGE